MMPLTMAKTGEVNLIRRIGGREDVRRFLKASDSWREAMLCLSARTMEM